MVNGKEFIEKIRKVLLKLEDIVINNYRTRWVTNKEIEKALNEEFGDIKFNKEFENKQVNFVSIFEGEILSELIKENTSSLNSDERVSFIIDAFKEIRENGCVLYENKGLKYILFAIEDEEDINLLFSRENEYINDKNDIYGDFFKQELIQHIPVLDNPNVEIERLQSAKKELKKAIISRTSKESLIKFLSINSDDEILDEIIKNMSINDVRNLVEKSNNFNNNTKFILSFFKSHRYNMMSPEDKELIEFIPILDDKDAEVKRLEKAKDLREKEFLLSRTTDNGKYEYINIYPKEINILDKVTEIYDCIENSNSDMSKTLMLMNLEKNIEMRKYFVEKIEDDFYKMKLCEGLNIYDNLFSSVLKKGFINNQIEEMNIYNEYKSKFEKIDNEEEKVKYIKGIDNNDMKLSFLSNIKDSKNREEVINSLERYVDPKIKELDNVAQKMIVEFFNDIYEQKIPQDKKEKILIALKKTSCKYDYLEPNVNGIAEHDKDYIKLEERNSDDKIKIGFLIHEYAHVLSNCNWKKEPFIAEHTLEEGNADVFADLVINHYLNKYPQNNVLNIERNESYETFSGYDYENAITRTLLYPLENENKDKKALCEFLLGDKFKYLEMVLSPEISKKINEETYGIISKISISYNDMYKCHCGEYLNNLNKDSIYLKRNDFINRFILKDQKLKEEKEEDEYER